MYDEEGRLDLKALARERLGDIKINLATPRLYEEIVRNREGHLSHLGPVVIRTGHSAQRSPQDVFVVPDPDDRRSWLGDRFRVMETATFERLLTRILAYLQNREIYVQDCVAAKGTDRAIPIRVATETAWHNLYSRDLLWPRSPGSDEAYEPAFTLVHVPYFHAVPDKDGTGTSAFVVIVPGHRLAVIGGTSYAGEIRQAVGAICRYEHAAEPVLPLRCAVVETKGGETAAFLGRTGNGKTALALDPDLTLVGDHDHGWDEDGLFSYERGCYARVQELTEEEAPLLHGCARRFGTILENVSLHSRTRRVDFLDHELATNTRAAFPMNHLPEANLTGKTGHPRHLFLLTRDATGVLPPLARLTADQAVFAFLTSYAASLAETEGAPGDVRPMVEGDLRPESSDIVAPEDYAKRFLKKIADNDVRCWFMNTGWSGEPEGRGERTSQATCRALVHAALSGALDDVPYQTDPLFLFEVPKECPGLTDVDLDPRKMAKDEGDYEVRASRLALEFIKGFSRFEGEMPDSVIEMVAAVPIDHESPDVLEQLMFSI